jgi:hypothetical protein
MNKEKMLILYNLLSDVMNIGVGLMIGYFASTYNWRILLLVIPYSFQFIFAIYFKNK